MGINKKYLEKYDELYKDLKTINPAIYFDPSSQYYHQEEWRYILQMYVSGVLPNMYMISNHGRVYTFIKSPSYPNGGIMKPSHNHHVYQQLNLRSVDGKKIGCKIARLVLLHFRFVENCHYLEVDHLDGNKDNNCLWNLEWVSPQENTHRAINNCLRPLSPSVDNGTLLTDEQALELYEKIQLGFKTDYLSQIYGVSEQYINNLDKGIVRPYIAKKYNYNHRHI